MADNLIHSTVSPKKLKFKPGENPAKFEVHVRNDSDDYASFQLAIEADYDKAKQQKYWYRISPEIGSFNPPGDLTKFQVELVDSPVAGFVGLMQLRLSVSSVELPDKDIILLPVDIEQGSVKMPLDLTMPVKEFHKSPGAVIDIPIIVRNLAQVPTNVNLTFSGIEAQWLRDGSERHFRLEGGEEVSKSFTCELPETIETIAKVYPFTIQADHSNGPSSSMVGTIEVLTIGYLDFGCQPKELTIPQSFSFAFWRTEPVTFLLKAENASNMIQELHIQIEKEGEKEDGGIFEVVEIQQNDEEKEDIVGIIDSIELLPNENEPIALRATGKRPWIGTTQRLIRHVNAVWSGCDRIDTRNENQTIILNIKPVFERSFIIQSAIFILLLLYFMIFLNPGKHSHENAVNTIEFNGVGDAMISGSTDQTIIEWNRKGFGLNTQSPKLGEIDNIGKAIRVARYKPVDNNVIAVGLENGEIQLWDLLSNNKKPLASFAESADDRVFDLAFTKDSRFLFSSHGSGKVLLWDITKDLRGLSDPNEKPKGTQKFDFSVFSLELVGNEESLLALVGRYNQFMVWNLANGKVSKVNYEIEGGQDDYIESLDVPESNPYIAVTSDNKGYITIWDLRNCSNLNQETCGKIIERWQDGHNGQAVRSVAFSPNGCYLASAGDDGNTKLWYLSDQGTKINDAQQGEVLDTSPKKKKFNTVDVITVGDTIYIVSGNEDTEVRLAERKRKFGGCDQ